MTDQEKTEELGSLIDELCNAEFAKEKSTLDMWIEKLKKYMPMIIGIVTQISFIKFSQLYPKILTLKFWKYWAKISTS